MMSQSIHGDAGDVTAAGRDHIEIETHDTHHHHHHPNYNRQNESLLGNVEIRRLGFKITGLNATFAIAGTVYLGSIALNGVLSLVQAYCEHVLFKVDHGSYIIHVFAKDAQSKQELLEQVTSKALENKLKDIFDKKVEVHLVEVGAVIATEEEFAQLKKHMEKKLKKVQFKIDNNCKGTIEDFCCTMPIFQNKSRFLMHEVTPDTEDDVIECLKNNLEFVKPDEESLLQTADEKNNAKVKQQGFLVQHPGFSKFSETFQSHPGLQEKVVEVIDTVEELVKQNYVMIPQVEAEKLLEFNPILFTGNSEMVTRKLAKFVKTFMYEKDFEITKSLLVWMIKLCNNIMDDERIKTLSLFFFKLIEVFLDFVFKSGQHLRGKDYARELCVVRHFNIELLIVLLAYIDFGESGSVGFNFSNRYLELCFIIGALTEQSGKSGFKLLHYYLKRLLLMTRNCEFEEWITMDNKEKKIRMEYDDVIHNLLQVAQCVVEISHSQCVRMVAEILDIFLSEFQIRNLPDIYDQRNILHFDFHLTPMHLRLLHSFNAIHENLESRKKSQCDNSSIFALLITIYQLLLLYNDQSEDPVPVTELSSCVLRLCYYHTHDNGKLPHELSISEIFDSGSKLLKQVTEKNKAAKKFRIYRNDSSKFDKVHDVLAFPQHLSSAGGTVSSNLKGTLSSGYGGGQGIVSSLPPPSLPSTQNIKSSFSERFDAQHKLSPPPSPLPMKK